jgi:hypothetical protein
MDANLTPEEKLQKVKELTQEISNLLDFDLEAKGISVKFGGRLCYPFHGENRKLYVDMTRTVKI